MAYSPSSDFQVAILEKDAIIEREFYIGDSDYTSYVTKWPKFTQSVNDLRPINVTINLANEEGTFNFFEADKTKLLNEGVVRVGVNLARDIDVDSKELLTVYQGRGERVKFRRGACSFTMVDKWTQLSERLVGDSANPVDFVSSNYLVSDIAWWLVTSYGGYSAIESTSNPDIDWEAYENYASVFSEDSVFINASFDGLKVTECLRKLGRMSDSQIFIIYTNSETKISFNRFTQTSSEVQTLDDSMVTDIGLDIDDRDMINRMTVSAAYSEATDNWGIIVTDQDSSSVNSFGLREDQEEDENVWYATSATAINFAQRVTFVKNEPFNKIKATTTLAAYIKQAGEGLEIDDSLLGFGQSFRVNRRSINIDTGQVVIEGDAARFFNGFTLDVDSLDITNRFLL